MLLEMTESVSNLASNVVADATISASLNIPSLKLSNEFDAWHSLGAHHRSCLQTIADNQNKNHAADLKVSAQLASTYSKLQARDATVNNLQHDADFIFESKSSVTRIASELATLSEELISLTEFLAAFREAHITRTVKKMKNDADIELLRTQKNAHARITAATRARDLNLDRSVTFAKAPASVPPASHSFNAPPETSVDTTGPLQTGFLAHNSDSISSAIPAGAPSALLCNGDTVENVIIDFEELLESDQAGNLSVDVSAAGATATGE